MNSVSVIIPVFNEEKTLTNVIKAVLNYGLAMEKIIARFIPLNRLKVITKAKKWKGTVAFKKWIVFNIELPKQALKNLFKKVK